MNSYFSRDNIQMANKHMKICSTSLAFYSVQFSCSVVSNSLDSMDCSMPGFPVHHTPFYSEETSSEKLNNVTQLVNNKQRF